MDSLSTPLIIKSICPTSSVIGYYKLNLIGRPPISQIILLKRACTQRIDMKSRIEQSYPFDPQDWTTIAPLFIELSKAEIPTGEFMAWLEQWNQLDIAVWDAYTVLKQRSYYDIRDQAAEHAYQAFVQQLYSTYAELTHSLIDRALTLQPVAPSPTYQQLWRRWQNQQTLFHPDAVPIQAEISMLEGQYRSIMREVDPDNPTAYWLDRREMINDLMLRLLHLRHRLARTCGQPHFLAYRWRELNRLDYSIADCQQFHRLIETIILPFVQQRGPSLLQRNAHLNLSDLNLLKGGVERILHQIDPSFGALFQSMREDYVDLGPRPFKADAVEEWFSPRAQRPYLHVASTYPGSVLHESGHGLHDYLSFQAQCSMWNLNGPEEFQEFAATSLDLMAWPYYSQEIGGPYPAVDSTSARQDVLAYYFDALVNCVMQDVFEHWAYSEVAPTLTAADLDAKWLELKARFTPWDTDPLKITEMGTGWQRWNWSLFRMPLYMITYPMAIVGACCFGRLADGNRGLAIDRYKAALSWGNTRTLPELFDQVGIAFPFTRQTVEQALRFMLEKMRPATSSL